MINAPKKSVRRAGATDVVVIGAGQAGLAMSYCLNERGIDHVVIERGEIANSWRNERWDSLKLLTPNWMTRLPGFSYSGDDPDGFMSVRDVARDSRPGLVSIRSIVLSSPREFRALRGHRRASKMQATSGDDIGANDDLVSGEPPSSERRRRRRGLEQTDDVAVVVDVHLHVCRLGA